MKFRPVFRVIPVAYLVVIVLLYSVFVSALYITDSLDSLRTFVLAGVVQWLAVALLLVFRVRLVVFSHRDKVMVSAVEALTIMRIECQTNERSIVLDRSGIAIKVRGVAFLSTVGMINGKKGARDYLTSVIKKFINYRFNKES